MEKNKLKLRSEAIRELTVAERAAILGGLIRETEPYSFCTLCVPVTRLAP